MDVAFEGEIWHWKGPAPHHFVTVPEPARTMIESVSELVTYGWGMVPATVHVGATTWATALWPKDGGYIVPLRLDVRRAEGLAVGDRVGIRLTVQT
ncbi:DUF1905 domain-containing protein [soil metagenome]